MAEIGTHKLKDNDLVLGSTLYDGDEENDSGSILVKAITDTSDGDGSYYLDTVEITNHQTDTGNLEIIQTKATVDADGNKTVSSTTRAAWVSDINAVGDDAVRAVPNENINLNFNRHQDNVQLTQYDGTTALEHVYIGKSPKEAYNSNEDSNACLSIVFTNTIDQENDTAYCDRIVIDNAEELVHTTTGDPDIDLYTTGYPEIYRYYGTNHGVSCAPDEVSRAVWNHELVGKTETTVLDSGDEFAGLLPLATTDNLGVVKPDGTTITVDDEGIMTAASYTLPTASADTLGGVKVDGSTITIADGVISASSGGAEVETDTLRVNSDNQLVKYDGTTRVDSLALGTATLADYLDSNGSTQTLAGSFAVGSGKAEGEYCFAEGNSTTASDHSHAEGYGVGAIKYSHAEGNSTSAFIYSHAEGNSTTASDHSHAEGYGTTASDHSHAEGYGTTASDYSHAEGRVTKATGYISHAEGLGTRASGRSQHVFGEYNVENAASSGRADYVEIVGNGTSSSRSNARTLDWSGNEVLAGGLTTGGSVTIGTTELSEGSLIKLLALIQTATTS